jgi:hypothetical protein
MSQANRQVLRASRALVGGGVLTIVSLAATVLLHGGWQSAAAAVTGLGGMIVLVSFMVALTAMERAAYGHLDRTPRRSAPPRPTEEPERTPAEPEPQPVPRPSSVTA